MTLNRIRLAVAGAVMLAPTVALAHTGHGEASGLVHGFTHPVGGLDHVLAMVLVGVLALQVGGRAIWAVPLAFLAVMAAGGGLGVAGVGLPFVEAGIALSIVGLGAAVALRLTAPVATAMALVGAFALFHGHAHGAEMPEGAGGLAYAAGFLVATALLHGCGLALGALAGRFAPSPMLLRGAGGLAAVTGLALLVGIV